MSNIDEFNWKVCFEIEPDKDFWFQRIIPEWEDYPTVVLDATDENVEKVIEQLMLCAVTMDTTKEYLKSEDIPEYVQTCQALAMILSEFHEYKKRHNEWIDFDINCPRGNQRFGVAVCPDYMFDEEWGGWDETSASAYIAFGESMGTVDGIKDFIAALEAGEHGFVPGEYRPPVYSD